MKSAALAGICRLKSTHEWMRMEVTPMMQAKDMPRMRGSRRSHCARSAAPSEQDERSNDREPEDSGLGRELHVVVVGMVEEVRDGLLSIRRERDIEGAGACPEDRVVLDESRVYCGRFLADFDVLRGGLLDALGELLDAEPAADDKEVDRHEARQQNDRITGRVPRQCDADHPRDEEGREKAALPMRECVVVSAITSTHRASRKTIFGLRIHSSVCRKNFFQVSADDPRGRR